MIGNFSGECELDYPKNGKNLLTILDKEGSEESEE